MPKVVHLHLLRPLFSQAAVSERPLQHIDTSMMACSMYSTPGHRRKEQNSLRLSTPRPPAYVAFLGTNSNAPWNESLVPGLTGICCYVWSAKLPLTLPLSLHAREWWEVLWLPSSPP